MYLIFIQRIYNVYQNRVLGNFPRENSPPENSHQTLPGKFPAGKLPPIKFPLILLIQFSVSHTNTSIFNVQFLRFYLHLLALFLTKDVSYKKKLASFQLAVTLPQSHYIIAIVKFSNRSIQNLFNVDESMLYGFSQTELPFFT